MKKTFTIFILLLSLFMISCNECEKEKECNDKEGDIIPFESLSTKTYVSSNTYDYESVIKFSDKFNIDAYIKENNIFTEDDYIVIENYDKWLDLYNQLTNSNMEVSTEKEKGFFEKNVRLIYIRNVSKSINIPITYQYDSSNKKIIKSYLFDQNIGEKGLYICLDVVDISKTIYDQVARKIESTINDYKLIIDDPKNNIVEKLNETYKSGEKVNVKLKYENADIEVFLDDKTLGVHKYDNKDKGYWEYTFTMPSHDAKLSIKIDGYINYTDYIHEYIDNMLIPLYLQEELIYNYLFNNNRTYVKEEKGYIYKYYGLYNSNLVVMMDTSKSAYYQKPYEEVIDGVKFTYQDSNRILVYSDGKFYSLQEAFDIGLLDNSSLVNIQIKINPDTKIYTLKEILNSDVSSIQLQSSDSDEESVKLSEIGQSNFIKLIDTEYKKTSSNDTWKLTNSLSGGSYYQYKLQLNNKEVIVPINNYNKIVIFIENDIYVSESSIDLNTIRFNMENEEKNISEITYNLVNEIKLAYIKTYYTIEDPIKLITLDDAIISYYHGYYNGYHIVMMEGYHSINKGIWIETIGGISIIYNDSNRLLAYKDGSFISLEEAYENKSLSKDDLQKISNLHNNSNKYNVRIIENTNKDNMLLELISYNMFSYLHVFDMKNSKFSTNISLDEYKGNELFKRIINSPCKKSINEQVINKEFVIRLSTDTSLLSYNFCVDLYLGYSTNTTLKELSVVINGINYFVEANENDLNELYNLLLNIVNNYKVRECTLFNELSILNVPEDITQISLMKLESIEPDKYSVKRLSCQMVNSDSQIRIFVEKAKNVNLIDITGNINSPISSNNIYEGYFTINNSNEEFEIKVIKTKDKKTYFILNNHIYELNNDSTSIGLSSIEIYTEILTKENYNELDIKEYVNSKININDMDISIEDILGSSYTNSDDIIKISRKSYNLNSWENNIDEYSITDKEVITKIIKLIENMNVTLDNNYTIPTGSIKEVYSIVYLDNKITFTISDEHIIYNYLYYKIDTDLNKFFTNETKIEKAYYQEKEIIDNRIIILVKKEYEKDEFTQSKFPLLELDSIEFFSLSRTLIIVPKDYDKYHITEAINLIKDLEFIEFIDANKVYQTIQIPNTVIYRSDNYIDHYNTLEDNINGFLDTIKKYEFPNGFSDLSWNNKVEYILNNDIYLPEMMKKLIKSNKYIIILNDFEYEYIDLDIF